MNTTPVNINNLVRLCKYIKERREGDFISSPNRTEHYLGFDSITQKELDLLCKVVKEFILYSNEDIGNSMIGNSMGEIIFNRGTK